MLPRLCAKKAAMCSITFSRFSIEGTMQVLMRKTQVLHRLSARTELA